MMVLATYPYAQNIPTHRMCQDGKQQSDTCPDNQISAFYLRNAKWASSQSILCFFFRFLSLSMTNHHRISHKRRYLECKAFFTETPSKHEAIHDSDVTQSAALISHGSVDVKCTILLLPAYICMFASLPLTSHGIICLTLAKFFPQQLTNVAGAAIHGSFEFGSDAFEKLLKRRRTRRRLATQPRKPTKLDFWKGVRGDADKMQMLMCVKLKAEVCACARARKGFVHISIGAETNLDLNYEYLEKS
ncbi:hypothetical protein YC2023_079714 [Brassica napus]